MPSEPQGRGGPRIAVVGGSISGLSAAILMEQLGLDVTVFERQPRGVTLRPAGVGLDLDLIAAITGQPEKHPVLIRLQERRIVGQRSGERVDVPVTGYDLLRAFLEGQLRRTPVRSPLEIVSVELDAGRLHLTDRSVGEYDVIVGADGWRSSIRGAILGASANAPTYAGYILWRGLVDESALGGELRAAFFDVPALHVSPHARQHFVAYPVPGPGGQLEPGRRRLSWGLYSGVAPSRLGDALEPERSGAAASTWAPGLADELRAAAAATGTVTLVDLVEASLAADAVTLWPVHELVVTRLVRGGAVLIGDAAHLASPITGNGARTAMYDALVLVRSLIDFNEVDAALGIYETRRLPIARALVEQGRAVGWGFLHPP